MEEGKGKKEEKETKISNEELFSRTNNLVICEILGRKEGGNGEWEEEKQKKIEPAKRNNSKKKGGVALSRNTLLSYSWRGMLYVYVSEVGHHKS